MKNRGIRMSSLLTLSNLAIVLLILSGAVFLFARTYQQQLIGTARTNSLRTVTQVSSTVNDYLAEINAVMRTLEEEMTDAEKRRTDFFDVFLRTRPDVVAVSTYDPTGNLSHCYSNLGPPTGTRSDGINLSLDLQRLLSEPDGYVSAVEYFDNESFQDYLDYCKYIYADSDAVPGRAGLSTVTKQDIVTLAGYFDNFRSWMETCKRLDEYDFDPTCVDNADWFRIKTEPLVFDDFTDEYADYTIWFFDSQTSTLYYFHLNI